MSLFSFKGLVKKFSFEPVFLLNEKGEYNYLQGGVYQRQKVSETEFEAAVVPLSNSDIKYMQNGTYTQHDRKIYSYFELQLQDRIRHKNEIYTIAEKVDYSDFDEQLYIYIAIRGESYEL